jgi:hypothetical protein
MNPGLAFAVLVEVDFRMCLLRLQKWWSISSRLESSGNCWIRPGFSFWFFVIRSDG